MNRMTTKYILCFWTALALVACGDDNKVDPRVPAAIEAVSGDGQVGPPATELVLPLVVEVTDAGGNPAPGAAVSWSVLSGDGLIAPASSTTDAQGRASARYTLGPSEGEQQAQATSTGLDGSPVIFTATSSVGPGPAPGGLSIVAGGNNVPERYSSDLWVHGNYAYTGTWGFREELGNALKVWSLNASGAPALAGTVLVPDIGTVSDVEVSDDGQLLVLSGEQGGDGGIYTYSLTDPANPTFLGSASVGYRGVHTVTLSTINGRDYAFAAMNPDLPAGAVEGKPALMIYDITEPTTPTLVRREPIEPHYGIHDTFVRDGLAFVFAWDEGVIIYDVGNGMRGGTPSAPVEISQLVTAATSNSTPAVHNGWWFHNPVTGEKRYLFIGQEGPGVVGSVASGDIHVVDVSNLENPVEVALFHLDGAGVHNFWMDEARQILYAAYYNAGVVALDVSGTLSGDLSGRLLGQVQPGGANNTYTWGVQLANGSLYAIDMLSGLWQLRAE
jgi:hypothetical protein